MKSRDHIFWVVKHAKDKAWLNVFSGTVDGVYAAAIFNYSGDIRKWNLKDLGFEKDAWEILHPLGKIENVVEVPSHDAVLFVSKCFRQGS